MEMSDCMFFFLHYNFFVFSLKMCRICNDITLIEYFWTIYGFFFRLDGMMMWILIGRIECRLGKYNLLVLFQDPVICQFLDPKEQRWLLPRPVQIFP